MDRTDAAKEKTSKMTEVRNDSQCHVNQKQLRQHENITEKVSYMEYICIIRVKERGERKRKRDSKDNG